ncbi:phage portal protein [Nocardioides sp. InS609-2]|uniref:phage portal protein n=1 Tax=Nocardioides sp. InS609-2 TaxID=2760705 RepID=UPI0020BDA82B|nr:phage portal protein [Nocardioides sp. InS609-2]
MGYLTKRLGQLLSEVPSEDEPVGDYSANVMPPSRANTSTVTFDRALGLPAVFRSIQILSGVSSQLTLGSWRGKTLVAPAPSLVVKPDPWRSLPEWIHRSVVSMASDGNIFYRKHLGPDRSIAAAEVLNAFLTHVRWVKGVKSYTTFDHRLGRFIDLADSDVLHVWGMQVPGHNRGISPITACRVSLGGALDVRDYASNWFNSNDVPSGVLSSDQQLDPGSVAMYRQIWHNPEVFDDQPDAATINRRLGPQIRVLGKGLSYQPIMLKPEDAQWIQAQNFGVLDVARMFGMPADYLHAAVEGTSLTYSNLEMIDTQFMRLTLAPNYLAPVETSISTLLPYGQTAKFDLAEWLRPDAKTRAEVDRIYLQTGVISPQDVHDRERFGGTAPGKPQPVTAPASADAPIGDSA